MSLSLKLALFAALLAVLLVSQWGISIERERRILMDETRERATVLVRTMAELSREAIAAGRLGSLDRQIQSFMGERDAAYAMILDQRSRVVAASDPDLVGWSLTGRDAHGTSIQWTADSLVARAPINIPGMAAGLAELGLQRAPLDSKLERSLAIMVRFLAAEIMLFSGFMVLLYIQLLVPVRALVARLGEVRPEAGHQHIDLPASAAPEIQRIACAVDDLRQRVSEYQAELLVEERLATIGRMAADMAHEIRNPLEAISGAVELLGGVQSGDDDFIRVIREEVRNLNAYLTGVLEFARKGGAAPEFADLAALATETAALAQPLAREAGVTIGLTTKAGPCLVTRLAVKRAIFNLILNAIEASPPGSQILVSTWRADREVLLQVQDHGCGLDPVLGERIFEPYVTTKAEGTGLGLALARQVLEDHGGHLTIERDLSGGTSARLALPAMGV